MKIVVIGGSGLIGSKLVNLLARSGHEVIADPQARYFGALLDDGTLVPAAGARIGPTGIQGWLSRQAPA